MFRSFFFYSFLFLSTLNGATSFAAGCGNCSDYQTFEIGVGWRRDNLDWRVKDMEGDYSETHADSHIRFDDIDMYTLKGKLKFFGAHYYVRLAGTYAISDKGRAKENFSIENPCLFCYDTISVDTNNHIKRKSEFYDFDLAVGYPFLCLDCKLSIIPLVGFSYHRQSINVRQKSDYSSDSFSVSSCSNAFCSTPSSDPFSSASSSSDIASVLGIKTHHDSANYRFSWYGPLAGVDLIYSLDNCWTLYAEFEGHFLSHVHRKRKSHTGVGFVDDYHHSGWAYGFDGSFGTCFTICEDWYCNIDFDYKWWKSDSKHDKLQWDSIGANVSLGYMF